MDNIPQDEPKEELKYSYEEIHDKPLDDIAEDKEEVKEDVKEPIKEEVKEPPKEEIKEPEEELSTAELAEEIANKIAEKNKPVEPEKDENEKYLEWAREFKEDKGREPNWTEVASHMKDEAIKAIEERQEQKAKQEEELKVQKAEAEKKQLDEFNKIVDEDLNDLYKSGKLTPIKDKDNPSDQGALERKALFQAMLETNKKRAEEGKRPIYSIKEIYYEHYKKPNAQPAGENAPISIGKGVSTQDNDQEIDYMRDVRKPWSWFKR